MFKPANRKTITEESNKVDQPGVTTGQSNGSSCHQPCKGDGGGRQDENPKMKSLVNKDEIHVKVKNNTIKEMFIAKFSSIEKAEIGRLEKEERIEKKKRLQQGWKIRRAHHERPKSGLLTLPSVKPLCLAVLVSGTLCYHLWRISYWPSQGWQTRNLP
jgi:hypothetical protein